jgi:hypothetical protein
MGSEEKRLQTFVVAVLVLTGRAFSMARQDKMNRSASRTRSMSSPTFATR